MDDREYIPGSFQGEWVKNPAYTGNKYDVFKPYKCKLLRGKFGYGPAKKGAVAYVQRVPSGQLYLSIDPNGAVFYSEAVEGKDFELIP